MSWREGLDMVGFGISVQNKLSCILEKAVDKKCQIDQE